MSVNTRTITLLCGERERLQLAVNPRELVIESPQNTLRYVTVSGETVHAGRGRGLAQVTLETFLPDENSRFYRGVLPEDALAMLRRWQREGLPVRLLISGSAVEPLFLICSLRQKLREGDRDVGIAVRLVEYTAARTLKQDSAHRTGVGGLRARLDERSKSAVYVTVGGEDLWTVAQQTLGDGSRWKEIAERSGIADPHNLPAGKELYLR